MSDPVQVILWPRLVRRPRLGTDWFPATRVLATAEALRSAGVAVLAPDVLRRPTPPTGCVFVFDAPTGTALRSVFPALLDAHLPFAVGVATAAVRTRTPAGRSDDEPTVTWGELRFLRAQGVVVASSGHHPVDFDRLRDEIVFGELAASRQEMQRRLGSDAWLLCHPGGRARPEVARLARDLGFAAGIVRERGGQPRPDPLRWPALVPRPWQSAGRIARTVAERCLRAARAV